MVSLEGAAVDVAVDSVGTVRDSQQEYEKHLHLYSQGLGNYETGFTDKLQGFSNSFFFTSDCQHGDVIDLLCTGGIILNLTLNLLQ